MIRISGTIELKKGKDNSVKRFHPWVFSGAIHKQTPNLKDGDWVSVMDASKNTIGHGHFHKGTIAVRILHFNQAPPSEEFYFQKIHKAFNHRAAVGLPSRHTNAFRLVHGEGDGLSGLIVDWYNGVAVVQAHSVGMYLEKDNIVEALKSVFKETLVAVYFKNPPSHESTEKDGYLFGMSAVPHIVNEYDHKFLVDWESGQKTGFFLDQRENRNLLSRYSVGKKVLNTFCYTGGFSIYALHAGAGEVHSVDASEKAISLTRENIQLNGFNNEKNPSHIADTFEFLKDKKDYYDLIILDPPAFAKHKNARHQAMKGYQRLNAEAFRMVKPGGIIFTFSCSQVVSRQLFYDTVVSAAIQSGRNIKVLHHLSQPEDHPVSIYHPEGEYLKGLVLYVD